MDNGHLNENRLFVLINSNCLVSATAKETIITIIQGEFDWHYFLQKARSSGLAPLMYQNLAGSETIKERLPADIWKGLKDTYYATVATNLLINEQVSKIIESFTRNKIDVILLKGIALNKTVYRKDCLRPLFADVDLLVKKEHISLADDCLKGLGYKSPCDKNYIENLKDNPYLNSLFYASSDASLFPVHLHWHISNASSPKDIYAGKIDMKKIWQEAVPLDGHNNILIMSAQHQLIYLAEHALKHSYDKLILLYDIEKTIEYYKDRLTWDKVISEAGEFGLSRPLYYSLYFTHKILGMEVPPQVLFRLKPKNFTFLERRFINAILQHRSSPHLSEVVYLAMHKSILGKLKFIFRIFFAPPSAMGQFRDKLSSPTTPMAYLRRIKQIFLYSIKLVRSLAV